MSSKKKQPKEDTEPEDQVDPGQEIPAQAEEEPADPLAAAQAERDDLLRRLQRVSADYMNYQKRAQRDIEQAREFANETLIKALLPVLDDMERALAAARDNHGEDDPLFTGMQMVHDQALETLGRFGLRLIDAEGKEFDPERHTAMMQQPSDGVAPNMVLQELQKGYELKGRTVRATAVIVSTSSEEAQPPAAQTETEPEDEKADKE